MTKKSDLFHAVFGVVFVGAMIAAGVFIALPAMQASGRRSVEAAGFPVDTIRPSWVVCMKGRQGFRWTSGAVRGKVCVGGFIRNEVTVF